MIGMFRDFFQIHADVLRNSVVLFILVATAIGLTILITWQACRKRAIQDAKEYLKQRIAESEVKDAALRAFMDEFKETIERLTVVQGTAHAAARSISEAVEKSQ